MSYLLHKLSADCCKLIFTDRAVRIWAHNSFFFSVIPGLVLVILSYRPVIKKVSLIKLI